MERYAADGNDMVMFEKGPVQLDRYAAGGIPDGY
jgi:hypothetical protein